MAAVRRHLVVLTLLLPLVTTGCAEIGQVKRGLSRLHLDRGWTTIPLVAESYAATDRATWIGDGALFYETRMGSDPSNLGLTTEPLPLPQIAGGDTKILFIGGLMGHNNREDPAAVKSWAKIREAMLEDLALRQALQDEDFLYFSYSGFYDSRSYTFGMPIYTPEDTYPHPSNVPTPLSHSVAFESLLLSRVIDEFPDAHFILIGHSLGGVVATYWAANKADREELDRVDLIVTLASPLRGVPGPQQGLIREILEYLELAPDTELVQSLRSAPGKIPMFTIRSPDDHLVQPDYATLPGVWLDMDHRLGDHSGILGHPYVGIAIAAAVRARGEAKDPLAASLLNAPVYDVVLPGETVYITLEVQNTGTLTWQPDLGYVLKVIGAPPEGVPAVLSLPEPVPPGDTAAWSLRFPVADEWGVRRYDFRMQFRETSFGPTLTAYVFILPEQLGNLEERIRERIEEWRRQGEQEVDELVEEILKSIQEELERQTINWLERILKQICESAGGAFGLALASVWLARRRSRDML